MSSASATLGRKKYCQSMPNRVFIEHLLKERLPTCCYESRAVLPCHLAAQVVAQGRAECWIGEERFDSTRDSQWVCVGYKQACLTRRDLLCCAVVAGRHDREGGRARLSNDVWHALAAREPNEDIKSGKQ